MIQNEKLIITDEFIKFEKHNQNQAVMHIGEKKIMQYIVDFVTKNGGDILEVGFGMHISADEIQKRKNVKSHTIIEIHPTQYQIALKWSENKLNTEIILGDWIDILPINNKKYDGIFHDTFNDHNIHKFLDMVKPNCKKGTIVVFFETHDFDERLDGEIINLTQEEIDYLPYGNLLQFKNKQFEFKYSIYDGNEFKKTTSHKTLF